MARFEPDYSQETKFTTEYPFESIIFPSDAPLLGADGNELQLIAENSRTSFLKAVVENGVISDVNYDDLAVNYDYYPLQDYLKVVVKGVVVIDGESYSVNLTRSEDDNFEYWWYLKVSKSIVGAETLSYIKKNNFGEELSKRLRYECSLIASDTELSGDDKTKYCLLLHTDGRDVLYRSTGTRLKISAVNDVVDGSTPKFYLYETEFINNGAETSADGNFYVYKDGKVFRSKNKIHWEDTGFDLGNERKIAFKKPYGENILIFNDVVYTCTNKGLWALKNGEWTTYRFFDDSDIVSIDLYRCSNGSIAACIDARNVSSESYNFAYYILPSSGNNWTQLPERPFNSVDTLCVADDGISLYCAVKGFNTRKLYVCLNALSNELSEWVDTGITYSSNLVSLLIHKNALYISNNMCRLYIYNKDTYEKLQELNLRYTQYASSGVPFICGDYLYYLYSFAGYEIPINDPLNYTCIYTDSAQEYKYGTMFVKYFVTENSTIYKNEAPIIVTNRGTSFSSGRGRIYIKNNGRWTVVPVPNEYVRLEDATMTENGCLCLLLRKSDSGSLNFATLILNKSRYLWNIHPIPASFSDVGSVIGSIHASSVKNRVYIDCLKNSERQVKTVYLSSEI